LKNAMGMTLHWCLDLCYGSGSVRIRIILTNLDPTYYRGIFRGISIPARYAYIFKVQLTYEVQLHVQGVATSTTDTTLTRDSYTYCTKNSYTYDVQLLLRATAAATTYSRINVIQLHLRGTELHLRGTAAPTRYSCTYEVHLHLRVHLYLETPYKYDFRRYENTMPALTLVMYR
jgi:hypothetical protein